MEIEFRPHAREKMAERSIAEAEVAAVLNAPTAVRASYRGGACSWVMSAAERSKSS